MSLRRKILLGIVGLGVAGFLVLQVLPVGSVVKVLQRDLNPPVTTEIQWDSPETEGILRAACYDCHSNETVWPWYSHIAPVSWFITRDVNKGRAAMNFSTDPASDYDVDDMEWHLHNDMPPRLYLPLHPEANLTDEQKALLIDGLRATFGSDGHSSMEGMDMDEGEGDDKDGDETPAATPDTP